MQLGRMAVWRQYIETMTSPGKCRYIVGENNALDFYRAKIVRYTSVQTKVEIEWESTEAVYFCTKYPLGNKWSAMRLSKKLCAKLFSRGEAILDYDIMDGTILLGDRYLTCYAKEDVIFIPVDALDALLRYIRAIEPKTIIVGTEANGSAFTDGELALYYIQCEPTPLDLSADCFARLTLEYASRANDVKDTVNFFLDDISFSINASTVRAVNKYIDRYDLQWHEREIPTCISKVVTQTPYLTLWVPEEIIQALFDLHLTPIRDFMSISYNNRIIGIRVEDSYVCVKNCYYNVLLEELAKYGLHYDGYRIVDGKAVTSESGDANYLFASYRADQRTKSDQRFLKEAIENGDVDRIFHALNSLDRELIDKLNVLLAVQE